MHVSHADPWRFVGSMDELKQTRARLFESRLTLIYDYQLIDVYSSLFYNGLRGWFQAKG